ncbi:MAG TPA: MFS transporter [Methylomirabilota bacterium]
MDRRLRRNVLALGSDFGLYLVGLSFASPATILPAFAAHLGASNVVIGAIPAVMTAGWFVPSLFAAGHTERLPWKLPFVLRYTAWERIPFLILVPVAFFVADRAPATALALLLFLLVVIAGVGGVLMPAWMDVVGRAVPVGIRGRFFALANLIGSVGGLFGGAATAYALSAVAPPRGYGFCFLGAAIFMALSYVALAMVEEPPAAARPAAPGLGGYLRRVPALLAADRNFTWFLLARALAVVGTMASGFYTVYALAQFSPPEWQIGVFTSLLIAGQVVGTLLFGWLADRTGHRLGLLLGVAASVVASALALAASSLATFSAVFFLLGASTSSVMVSGLSVLLEFARTVEERPTYIGIGNTAIGSVSFVAPLVAGVMADTVGFPPIFAVAALFGAAGFVLLLTRVRDPRSLSPVVAPTSVMAS